MAKKKSSGQKDPSKENIGRSSTQDQIKELEERIAKTKYNKKTQHAIGLYKAKLAQLKNKQEARKSSGVGKSDHGWAVKKSGDSTVVLLGFPSVGKSSLLNVMTNAKSEVGAYAFTTLTCIPGDLEYKGAKIQILDVPGIVQGAAAGTGRGKEVLQVIRNADLIVLLLDVFHPEHLPIIQKEIIDTYVRVNQKRPDVRIKKTIRGGIRIGSTVPLKDLSNETITAILKEFKVANADVLIRTQIDADQFIDAVEGNRVYIPAVTVVNKIDMVDDAYLEKVKKKARPDICVSTETKEGIEDLKELIYQKLELMPIYCKEAGKKADLDVPLILRRGDTIEEMCRKLHKDFVSKFRFARVWGKSAKFEGQKLSLKHALAEGDIVELHIR